MSSYPEESKLRSFFSAVDKDNSNHINCHELQSALSNGTFEPFNIQTVRLMISMFDSDKSGTINFQEFTQLWRYITDWLNCFQSYDSDKSGHIDKTELNKVLTTFGYRFTDSFYDMLSRKFNQRVYFDDFIRICVHLQTLTNQFRQYDTDLDGFINISYEQFVSLVFNLIFHN